MLDFHHSWPYERVMNDMYFEECPFCHASPVLISIKKEAVKGAFEGVKTYIIMPCCHEKVVIESMDSDYIWTTQALR